MNYKYYTQITKAVNKMLFYVKGFYGYYVPAGNYRKKVPAILNKLSPDEREQIAMRVDYYNQMPDASLGESAVRKADFVYPFGQKRKRSAYFFDLYRHLRYFPSGFRFSYVFGDVTEEPPVPAIVKSRPIHAAPSNSVLMKLDRVRHFVFIHDSRKFRDKKNLLISRNVVRQPHRIQLLEMYFDHPMCDLGQVNNDVYKNHTEWKKGFITISEQLDYKFIACIEGNDVATNLKWVMSSNSLAVMPRPRYETWYMEGTLIPNYHYVEIKPDYSDLIERMNYYIEHPEEAEAIIEHAHEYIRQFQNRKMEKVISVLVLEKYASKTSQL